MQGRWTAPRGHYSTGSKPYQHGGTNRIEVLITLGLPPPLHSYLCPLVGSREPCPFWALWTSASCCSNRDPNRRQHRQSFLFPTEFPEAATYIVVPGPGGAVRSLLDFWEKSMPRLRHSCTNFHRGTQSTSVNRERSRQGYLPPSLED